MSVRVESNEDLVPIKIVIDRSIIVHKQSDTIQRAWQELCDVNPRYFNGSMLSFDSFDPKSGVIQASVEEYKNHAVRDSVDVGISLLAVTAVLAAPDQDQNTTVFLLGRRSTQLHRYGGLWELGPSGGVDVPRFRRTLKQRHILKEVAREIKEEIGIRISTRPHGLRAIIHDHEAGSTDIVIAIVLEEIPLLKMNWEYSDTRWVTIDELYEWVQTSPEELIPTTVELARILYETRS
ncbi:MAG: NUDIX domain-containing protein [Phycisphaerales bacterium]|nr:NUDIX domain-containing protein [Phycisphaerales bacterium]